MNDDVTSDRRLREELERASERIGFESVEHAFWIFIPKLETLPAHWTAATGQSEDGLSPRIRLPVTVLYSPSKQEIESLLVEARECDWIIHVHNHPVEPYPGVFSFPGPSRQDFLFALWWRDAFAEVTDRLRFFVVQEQTATEYGQPQLPLPPGPDDFPAESAPQEIVPANRIPARSSTATWIDRVPPRIQDAMVWGIIIGAFFAACGLFVFLSILRHRLR